jgi:hypothetical protein
MTARRSSSSRSTHGEGGSSSYRSRPKVDHAFSDSKFIEDLKDDDGEMEGDEDEPPKEGLKKRIGDKEISVDSETLKRFRKTVNKYEATFGVSETVSWTVGERLYEFPLPSWLNDGSPNQDWYSLQALCAMAYPKWTASVRRVSAKKGWSLYRRFDNFKIFAHKEGSYVISVCGTRLDNLSDLANDAIIALGAGVNLLPPLLVKAVIDLLDEALPRYRDLLKKVYELFRSGEVDMDKTTFVGHSLGGMVALLLGRKFKRPTVGLNAGGFGYIRADKELCVLVRILGDPISNLFNATCCLKEVDLGLGVGFTAHKVSNFERVSFDEHLRE